MECVAIFFKTIKVNRSQFIVLHQDWIIQLSVSAGENCHLLRAPRWPMHHKELPVTLSLSLLENAFYFLLSTFIGPQHCLMEDIGRAKYAAVTDKECLDAFMILCRIEGIIPASESENGIQNDA